MKKSMIDYTAILPRLMNRGGGKLFIIKRLPSIDVYGASGARNSKGFSSR